MALSAQDQAYYEKKLNLKSYWYLLAATAGIGMIGCPLLFYTTSMATGTGGAWDARTVVQAVMVGFLLGATVSTILYMTLRLLLEMGWLPARQ